MKSNRLQNKDPVDQNGIGREVTIKVELEVIWDFVGPISVAPPGVKAGAIWFGALWCPHPGPLSQGEEENRATFCARA